MENIDYDFIEETTSAAKGAGKFVMSESLMSILLIVTCVLAVVSLALGIINLVMNLKNNTRLGNVSSKIGTIQTTEKDTIGVVFCKNCGNQFAANEKQCPYCGTHR